MRDSCSSIGLSLQEFKTVDVPFDRSSTVRQRQSCHYAMRYVSPRFIMKPTSPSEHSRKRSCIKYSANICDLTALDLIPFSDESRSGGGVGDHIV